MKSPFGERLVSELKSLKPACFCPPTATIRQVIDTLKANKIGSIVISGPDSRAIGIFTERDVLMKVVGNADVSLDEPIENYMTRSPKWVTSEDTIERAMLLMRVGRFRHLVVVDKSEKIQNVLSVKDLTDFILDEMI